LLTKLPRWIEGLIFAVLILLVIFGALMLAQQGIQAGIDAGTFDKSKSCSGLNWRWFGCAMAVHEDLAGGLIGGGGALFAAWLAASVVREQIADERKRDRERKEQQRLLELDSLKTQATGGKSYLARFDELLATFDQQMSANATDAWRNVRALRYLLSVGLLEPLTGPYPGEMALRAREILNSLRSRADSGKIALQQYDATPHAAIVTQLEIQLNDLVPTTQRLIEEARGVRDMLAENVTTKEEAIRKLEETSPLTA
jgi:hypothetical protein